MMDGDKRGDAGHDGLALLPSKTSRPIASADMVRRSGTKGKLSLILQRPVTTVTAPAGFGKTTAVAAWAAEAEVPVAWCTLDEDDADPTRLWTVVVQALEAVGIEAGFATAIGEVDWADALQSHNALARLLSLLANSQPLVLVFEDYHTVQDAMIVSDGMAYFMRNLPDGAHVVITSRMPVRLPLAKMRASGLLNEIGEGDLRMTADEQALFFSRLGIDLAAEEIARIDEATQGWAAGCRLVGLRCGKGSASEVAEAVAAARDNVNDYLFEEVLSGLDDALLRFMVETSAADAFSVDLAAQVTELPHAEAQKHLDDLMDHGLFVQRFPGADGEDWYRYHQMLLELLRMRLKRLPDSGCFSAVTRAREWFMANGFDDAAVGISFWIRDWNGLCELVMMRWKHYFMNDGHATILRWMNLLPSDLLYERPFLCAVSALPYALSGDAVKGREMIQRAMVQLHDDNDFLYAFCVSQRALLAAVEGKGDEASTYASRALDYLPPEEDYLRAMMIQTAAGALWRTDPLAAKEAFLGALALQRSFGNRNVICSAYANLSVLCADMGQIAEAEGYCEKALGLYSAKERESKPMLGFVHRARAACAYERGDSARFDRACADYEALARGGAVGVRSAELATLQAKVAYAGRKPDEGRACFLRAVAQDRGAATSLMPSLPMVADWCANSRAEALAVSGCLGDELSASLFGLSVAYCLDDVSCYEKMLSFVDAVDPRNFSLRVRTLTLAAAFADKVARQRQGIVFLREAYAIAVERGLMTAFLENAPMLRGLIPRLLSELDRDEGESAATTVDRAIAARLEECLAPERRAADALTERELDVLRAVADGASVAEAAQALVVSRETVKKHLGNIYTKLGVHSKMAAVALLREEGTL